MNKLVVFGIKVHHQSWTQLYEQVMAREITRVFVAFVLCLCI